MNQMAHPGKPAQMELQLDRQIDAAPGLTGPVRDLAYYLGICETYKRCHGRWPSHDSSRDSFVEARVDGYDGRLLNTELRRAGPALERDPAYRELLERCLADGQTYVDLSVLDPRYRNALSADALAELFNGLSLSGRTDLQRSRIETSARRADNELWLNVNNALRDDALRQAGFDPSNHDVRRNSYSINARVTDELRNYIDQIGMVYGADLPRLGDTYYLEITENNRLYVKYQTIIGSRFAGRVNPAEFVAKLAGVYAADPLLAPHRAAAAVNVQGAVGTAAPKLAAIPASPADAELQRQLRLLEPVGQSLKLPAERLSRYADIKRTLEKAGGKYRTSKQQFDFEAGIDPADVLARLVDGDKINFKQQFQFFATNADEARQTCVEAGPLQGRRVLEPSAGDGAIADVAREMGADVVTVELWSVNAEKLRAKGYDPIERDFLSVTPDEIGMFDAIVANPPFTKDQDIAHVEHMCKFLKPGGSLSAIMWPGWVDSQKSRHVAFREFLASQDVKITPIEAGAFSESGTNVRTVRLTLRDYKPAPEAAPVNTTRRRLA